MIKSSEFSNTIGGRLAIIREKLCNSDNKRLAELLKIAPQSCSNMCNNKKSIGNKTINKILDTFPSVNRAWLILGEGPMQKDLSIEVVSAPEASVEDPFSVQAVPCIPSGVYRRRDFDCLDYIRTNPVPRIPLGSSFGTIDVLYTVRDESMLPMFTPGDILGLREIPLDSTIVNGNVYLVDSRSCGLLLRIIHDIGNDNIELVPMERNRYRPFVLSKSDIIRAFCSIFLVRTNL